MYLPPGHPIIAIRNNRNQNGRRIGKKVYNYAIQIWEVDDTPKYSTWPIDSVPCGNVLRASKMSISRYRND